MGVEAILSLYTIYYKCYGRNKIHPSRSESDVLWMLQNEVCNPFYHFRWVSGDIKRGIKYKNNNHSDACIYLPPYKLDVLKIVEYKFSCEMEAHVEVTSLMFDCNAFKDKRHLLILVAITLPSKELQFCHFIMQTNSK